MLSVKCLTLKTNLKITSLILLFAASVFAADQVVTNAANSGVGTFRQAVIDVGAGENITFDFASYPVRITLGGTDINITKSLNIIGRDNPRDIVLDGNHSSRWRKWTENEQDVFKEIGRRLGDGLNAMLYFKNLQAIEERERAFQKRLTGLHDVSIALSKCKTENELWEQAIRLGRNKLGFDRLGIWLTTEKPGKMRATFGTDIKGNVIDERKHINITNPEFAMLRALETKTPCYYEENEKIYDDDFKKIIGCVACAVAPLWDGDNVIGGISTDNYIQRKKNTENDRKLLTLYASLLGHLGTRIQNEERNRAFQEKLTELNLVSTELSKCSSENELWKRAIELGIEKLGFDRLGIWLIVNETEKMKGTFGTDLKGNIIDEHNFTYKYNKFESEAIQEVIKLKKTSFYVENHQVLDRNIGEVVGYSDFAVAPLWNGVKVIGIITMDNFIQKKIISENDRKLLVLFASLLGHLGTRIRNEEKRLELEREMLHGQKLESLGVLAGGIAHDFNNILMAVMGYSDLVLQNLPDYSPVRDDVKEIRKAASRAAELSKQMLAYSGKGKFVIELIDLNKLVEEMSHILDVSISKKVTLKYDFENELPMFDGDATQIRQIIMNIITNASEAIGDKNGAISISTGTMVCDSDRIFAANTTFGSGINEPLPRGNFVYLEVSDTGCGMDEKTREKLFDPFFTTKFTGRGLGMAAVLGIVRGHKGAIRVSSEPGKGTTFKVIFRITETSKLNTNEKNIRISAKNNWHGTGTILIADDEETVCELGKRMFEMIGFKTLTAVDGQQAVDIFRDNADEIVCVILDLTMPNMSGNQAFHEIRLIRPDAKVILSSGYNEQDATQHFSGKGLSGFIQKPYSVEILLKTLREVIEAK